MQTNDQLLDLQIKNILRDVTYKSRDIRKKYNLVGSESNSAAELGIQQLCEESFKRISQLRAKKTNA